MAEAPPPFNIITNLVCEYKSRTKRLKLVRIRRVRHESRGLKIWAEQFHYTPNGGRRTVDLSLNGANSEEYRKSKKDRKRPSQFRPEPPDEHYNVNPGFLQLGRRVEGRQERGYLIGRIVHVSPATEEVTLRRRYTRKKSDEEVTDFHTFGFHEIRKSARYIVADGIGIWEILDGIIPVEPFDPGDN